jgi:hypothetical protein
LSRDAGAHQCCNCGLRQQVAMERLAEMRGQRSERQPVGECEPDAVNTRQGNGGKANPPTWIGDGEKYAFVGLSVKVEGQIVAGGLASAWTGGTWVRCWRQGQRIRTKVTTDMINPSKAAISASKSGHRADVVSNSTLHSSRPDDARHGFRRPELAQFRPRACQRELSRPGAPFAAQLLEPNRLKAIRKTNRAAPR